MKKIKRTEEEIKQARKLASQNHYQRNKETIKLKPKIKTTIEKTREQKDIANERTKKYYAKNIEKIREKQRNKYRDLVNPNSNCESIQSMIECNKFGIRQDFLGTRILIDNVYVNIDSSLTKDNIKDILRNGFSFIFESLDIYNKIKEIK